MSAEHCGAEAAVKGVTKRTEAERNFRKDKRQAQKESRRQEKESKRDRKTLVKKADKEYVDGQCVWNALLHGVAGLGIMDGNLSHPALLKRLVTKTPHSVSAVAAVRWNGEPLSAKQINEVIQASQNLRIQDGYFCGACDPLLVAVCALFQCNIEHNLIGHLELYETDNPRRVIHLESSSKHMSFSFNQELRLSCHGVRGDDEVQLLEQTQDEELALVMGKASITVIPDYEEVDKSRKRLARKAAQ